MIAAKLPSRTVASGHNQPRRRGPDARARTKASLDPRMAAHLLFANCATAGNELAMLRSEVFNGQSGGLLDVGRAATLTVSVRNHLAEDRIRAGLQAPSSPIPVFPVPCTSPQHPAGAESPRFWFVAEAALSP